MKYFNETSDFQRFTAAVSAKWSLASNARQHPIVKQRLKTLQNSLLTPVSDHISDIFQKDVSTINKEMKLSIQKAAKSDRFKNDQ